jgi:hypothetical protein
MVERRSQERILAGGVSHAVLYALYLQRDEGFSGGRSTEATMTGSKATC